MGQRSVINSSEDFCCKRGHAAILPSTQFLPRACSAHCATDALNPSSQIWPAFGSEPESRAKDAGRAARRSSCGRTPPRMESMPSPMDPASMRGG